MRGAGAYLGITPQEVKAAIDRGELKGRKRTVNGRSVYRVQLCELDRWANTWWEVA